MQRSTQTHDDLVAVTSRSLTHASALLTRFFRADAPAIGMDEFRLEEHPTWTLGRIDSRTPGASELARVFSRDDALMSARHAFLRRRTEFWEVEDAGSKNGIFVNGDRVQEPRVLGDGDILECGSSFFIYRKSAARSGLSAAVRQQPWREIALSVPPLHYQIAPILPFAASELAIHLHGETGTGKEVVAHAIHDLSGRRGAFVALNCAAIPDNLFESELFGYVKGAFSGASSNKLGQILEANRGTLFLDEIGELSLPVQAKLLRVLELKEILPIGATKPVRVDFRLISATLCDLRAMVAEGRFRRDLYGRLGQAFELPPLREHKEYIGVLMPALLAGTPLREILPIGEVRFSIAAARALVRYSWPFNIRELKQSVQSALTAAWAGRSADGPLCIDVAHLPPPLIEAGDTGACGTVARSPSLPQHPAPKRSTRSPSDADIVAALQYAGGNRAEAARALGVSERTMFRRIRKLRP